jgi:hypothetical protein
MSISPTSFLVCIYDSFHMHHEKSTVIKWDSVNIFTPSQLDANLLPPANLLASVQTAIHIP